MALRNRGIPLQLLYLGLVLVALFTVIWIALGRGAP